jgi:hypothetical protein
MNFVTIANETRKARKQHRCIWCGEPILPGETYAYVRGVFEGDPQSNHYHQECDKACDAWAAAEGGSCEFSPYDNVRPTLQTSTEQQK